MEIRKTTKTLVLISLVAVVFNIGRLDVWGTTSLLYLIWNLFLAWIPYLISLYFIKKDTPMNVFVPAFIVWLLFFPNAPYLVTDVLHVVTSSSALLWYDSLLFFFFGWIGLLLGMLSLFQVHQYLKGHLNYFLSEISVLGICFVSSFGIYLGRFERWNSWDIFVSPFQLMRHSLDLSASLAHTGTPLVFVFIFTIFIYSVYKTICVFWT